MTRPEKLHAVATRLNARVDVPAVPEWAEQVGFDWLLARLDSLLPDMLLDVMVSAADGVSDAEAHIAAGMVEHFLRSRLPTLLTRAAAVELVVDRIGDAVHDLLLLGNTATDN